ncbi:hypothetical protein HMPREF1317_1874, partial [Schaalia georgiae F0490]
MDASSGVVGPPAGGSGPSGFDSSGFDGAIARV